MNVKIYFTKNNKLYLETDEWHQLYQIHKQLEIQIED